MNWIIKDQSDSLTSSIAGITTTSADVLDAQALDKRALNRWVGIMTLSRGAPAVAHHAAFGKGEQGCGEEHWDLQRWETKAKFQDVHIWGLNLDWLKTTSVGSSKDQLALELGHKVENQRQRLGICRGIFAFFEQICRVATFQLWWGKVFLLKYLHLILNQSLLLIMYSVAVFK